MAQIKGTNVGSPVVPFDSADVNPSHEALYGKGGFRTVATTAARDAIPTARREAGMLVHVTADGVVYELAGDLTTWGAFTPPPGVHTQTASTITDFTSAVVAAAPPTTDASLLTAGTLSASRLPASGVTAGEYTRVTVDGTGRVTAGSTHSVSWDDVGSKPSTFTPSAHTHDDRYYTESEVDTLLTGKQASGTYATLVGGTVPSAQLPSYVDDVIEAANLAALPGTGETGKIYVTTDTNKTYRWSGSTYVEVSPGPGSTDSVVEGSTNLYFTNARASAAAPVQSVAGRTGTITLAVGDVTNAVSTSDSRLTDAREWTASTVSQAEAESGTATDRRAWTAQRVWQAIAAWWASIAASETGVTLRRVTVNPAAVIGEGPSAVIGDGGADFTNMDVYASSVWFGASQQTTAWTGWGDIPVSSSTTLGGVKVGSGLSIDGSGVLSATYSYTLPNATTSTLGGVIVGTGLAVSSGTVSVSYGTSSGTACQGNDSRLSDQRTPTDGSVTTAKLADGAVTGAKIASTSDIVASTISLASYLSLSTGVIVSSSGGLALRDSAGTLFNSYFIVNTSGHVTTGQWRSTAVAVAYGGTGATTAADARTNLGLGGAAVLNVGTAAGTVAAGDHTHSQLHDRSHAMTSSSDHTATAWRLFYSNGSGVVTELALGTNGQALLSGGASAAPSWGSAGSTSASDLTSGTLAYARMADPTVTSPSQITASQNDYASFARGINRFTTNGAYNLTGMAAGNDGEVRVLCNVGTTAANTLTIKDQNTSSTAANRFAVPWAGDLIINNGASVVVYYDNTTARWRVV